MAVKDFGQRRAIERRTHALVGLSAELVAQFFAAMLRGAHGGDERSFDTMGFHGTQGRKGGAAFGGDPLAQRFRPIG